MNKTLIVHPNFQELGEKIAASRGMNFPQVDFKSFPDSWPNLFAHKVKECIEHQDVTYIGDFSKPEDLFMQYALMRWILDYYAGKLRVIMPYFPVGTMERIAEKGEIATAKYFADIMSHLPEGRNAKTSIHTFDIHALVERFLFDSFKVNAEMHTAMNHVRDLAKGKVIVFPDDGAHKRFGKDFPDNEIIILSKVREWEVRKMALKEGNPEGKDLLLVDDLIQSGNTLIEAAKFLRSLGAKSVSGYATHGVFPGESHKKLAEHLDILYVTDSIPINISRAQEVSNMLIISLQKDFEKIIFAE
jgi:ribose-phosphate pyrophosphokinase